MIAGIPFANSNGKRSGAGGDGESERSTISDIDMSKMCWISVTCRKERRECFHSLENMEYVSPETFPVT